MSSPGMQTQIMLEVYDILEYIGQPSQVISPSRLAPLPPLTTRLSVSNNLYRRSKGGHIKHAVLPRQGNGDATQHYTSLFHSRQLLITIYHNPLGVPDRLLSPSIPHAATARRNVAQREGSNSAEKMNKYSSSRPCSILPAVIPQNGV